jgi:hypothetical protein
MKKNICAISIFGLLFFTASVWAQEDQNEEEVPPGMEIVKVGDVRAVVIKGTKIQKKGDLMVLEGTKEFVARKFLEYDENMSGLKTRDSDIEKELEQLRKELNELKEKVQGDSI